MVDALAHLLLQFPRAPRLCVLIYHRVLATPDPLRPSEPTAAEFEDRMRWVKRHFNVVALADGIERLNAGGLPPRALAITFDDGYRDNYDIAMPILARLGLPATFFIATGYLDGGRMFNDTVIESLRVAPAPSIDLRELGLGTHVISSLTDRARVAADLVGRIKYRCDVRESLADRIAAIAGGTLPRDLMMTSAQVAALRQAGMEVGCHTVSHPILTSIPAARVREEIRAGRTRLEEIVGAPVQLFAYPNGQPGLDYDSVHVALVREAGFSGAVTTAWGAAGAMFDPLQVPRFTPWDRENWRFGLRLVANLTRTSHKTV